MLYFPQPYPNEILYSILARYHEHSLLGNQERTNVQLFSNLHVSAILDFPRNLEQLKNNVGHFFPYSTDEIINKFTLFPYYKNFFSPERFREVIRASKERSCDKTSTFPLAFLKRLIKYKTVPDYCPLCIQEDTKIYGEAYWHLEHQVPGMIICLKHNCYLNKVDPSTKKISPKFFIPATPEFCKDLSYTKCESQPLKLVSQKMIFYLRNQLPSSGQSTFFSRALEAGFVKKNKIQFQRLSSELEKFFSQELLLNLLQNDNYRKSDSWLHKFIYQKERKLFPLGQILIEVFFENYGPSTNFPESPFGGGPWPCINQAADHYNEKIISNIQLSRNRVGKKYTVGIFTCSCGMIYTKSTYNNKTTIRKKVLGTTWEQKLLELAENQTGKRQMALQLGVSHSRIIYQLRKLNRHIDTPTEEIKRSRKKILHPTKLSQRKAKIKKLKREWISLLEKNNGLSVTVIKDSFFYGGYKYLFKHANEWFSTINDNYRKAKKSSTELKWSSRDKMLLPALKEEYDQLLKTNPRRRITQNLLIAHLSPLYPFFGYTNLKKLPLCRLFLSKVCENSFNFQKRIIEAAIMELSKEGKDITLPAVRKKAQIHYPLYSGLEEMVLKF